MKAKQQLRPPENWQDFESLSKKLWGEIWQCPEIVKNGRQGQPQCGVDVYGIPKFDNEYYGIQCKGKDNYTQKQFTTQEIDEEVDKAKTFKPKLKKFYLATTSVKNVEIEEYIRIKNLKQKKAKLFEIYLFSWEDIVDLIDENRRTHDWFVKSQNFRKNQIAKLTFHDNSEEITIAVTFIQNITEYKQRINLPNIYYNEPISSLLKQYQRISKTSVFPFLSGSTNHSYCDFHFRLHNIGIDPIEDFKIFLVFDGKFEKIDTIRKGSPLISQIAPEYDTYINSENKTGKIIPNTNIIVGDDSLAFDEIYIKPIHEPTSIKINWKLVSKDFQQDGNLLLHIKPEIKKEYITVLVDDPLAVRLEEGEIEDYITGN